MLAWLFVTFVVVLLCFVGSACRVGFVLFLFRRGCVDVFRLFVCAVGRFGFVCVCRCVSLSLLISGVLVCFVLLLFMRCVCVVLLRVR